MAPGREVTDNPTILLKSCPRCQLGDIEVERDYYGWRALCLQCGYVTDLTAPVEAEFVLRQQRRERETLARPA